MNREVRARAMLAELEAMGLTPQDLVGVSTPTPNRGNGPTVGEYVEVVRASYGASTAQTYGSYWRLLVAMLGDRRVASITYDDCATVLEAAGARARAHGRSAAGRSGPENCVAALRAFFASLTSGSIRRSAPPTLAGVEGLSSDWTGSHPCACACESLPH